MPLPGRDLKIGNYSFEIVGDHQIGEEPLGPIGPINFTMDDWAGGLATIEEGIVYRQQPQFLSGKGTDASFPGQVLVQPQATTVGLAVGSAAVFPTGPLKQVDFGTSTFLGVGQYVYRFVQGAGWVTALDMTGGINIADIAVGNGQIGVAAKTVSFYSSDGVTWTNASTAADRYGILNNKVFRAVRPNTLYATTGAFNGAWDSGSVIADSSWNINALTGMEQLILIAKEDGVYSIDYEGLVVPFTPELKPQANALIGDLRATCTFNADYYFRTVNGAIEISSLDGQKHRIGLDTLASPDLPTNQIKAFAADDRFLYALCANTSNGLQILRRDGKGRWYPFYWDANAGAGQHLAVSGALGYPALFFSYGTSGVTVKAIRLSQFPNPLQDTGYAFDASGATAWVRIPRIGSPEAQLIIDRLTVQTRYAAAGITITPWYSVDGGALTQFGASAITSNPATTFIPTTPIQGNFVDLYFYMATNSAAASAQLLGWSYKGAWQSSRRRTHTYNVILDKYHPTRRGGNVRRDLQTIIGDLDTIRASNVYQTIVDENGVTFQGIVQEIDVVRTPPTSPVGIEEPESQGHVARLTLWEKPTN